MMENHYYTGVWLWDSIFKDFSLRKPNSNYMHEFKYFLCFRYHYVVSEMDSWVDGKGFTKFKKII